MNSQLSSPPSAIAACNISVWDQSAYERVYIGWCIANLNSKLLQEALSFIDESWFCDWNRKTIYSSIVKISLESNIARGLKITKEKIAAIAQHASNEHSQWASLCIEDCIAAECQTLLSIDLLETAIIDQWKIVKTKPFVQDLLAGADQLLVNPVRTKDGPRRIAEILQTASEAWNNSVYQIRDTSEVTESKFIDEILTPIDPSTPLFAPCSLQAFDDQMLGGVAINSNTIAGRLILVAARPAVGKTALSISVAKGIAMNGHKIIYYTMEVPRRQMFQRLLCVHDFHHQLKEHGALIDCIRTTQVPRRSFTSSQIERIEKYRNKISENIEIYDKFVDVDQIAANLIMRKKRDPSIVTAFIDHLGLLNVKHENRAIAIGDITRRLKQLAVELTMDIVLIHQLNRESEKRNNKRPMLSDLRDSGNIEQDADAVIGLYREMDRESDELELISLKNRHNSLGTTKCKFYLQYGTVM